MAKFKANSTTPHDVIACLNEKGIDVPKIPTGIGTHYVSMEMDSAGVVGMKLTTGSVQLNNKQVFESVVHDTRPVPLGKTNVIGECIDAPKGRVR